MVSKSLALRCCLLPGLMVPTLSWPGFNLAWANTLRSVVKRAEAATNTPRSKQASVVMGAKAFSVS